MNKSNMEFLITSMINSLIIFVICFCVLFNKKPVVYCNETNAYAQYIEWPEQIEDDSPIAGVSGELYKIRSDQSLLGYTSDYDVTGTDSSINFEYYPEFRYSMNISEQDKYLLAKLNECEAGNQNIRTRELVVLVVLNRVNISDSFPNTIEEVITQKYNGIYQFSPLDKGGSWYSVEPTEDAYLAVENVINSLYDYSGGALYFESCQNEDNWHSRNLEFLYQSQDIRFYRQVNYEV